ncbi:MAG: GspE/PulE family protein [Patescibacteria group bacterium]
MSVLYSISDANGSAASQGGGAPSLQVASKEIEKKLEKKISQIALKEKEIETERFARSIGYSHIDLEKFPISHAAMRQISEEKVRELGAVCFMATPDEIRIGALDPTEKQIDEIVYQLEERNHAKATVYVISEKSLDRILEMYKTLPTVKPISKDIEIKESDLDKVQANVKDLNSLQELLAGASTTDSLTAVLAAALRLNASDVHIEAGEQEIIVRVRLDGILYDAATIRKDEYNKMVSRIKLVSSLKININDAPQDGRFSIKLSSGDVDVRVSTIPTVYGESIVMRLLVESHEQITLESLGLSAEAFEKLKRQIERPNGMIIATGPTGSGKSTTLYAIMYILNKPGVKIITLEDPVEYKVEGINQSQIDENSGYTFAKGLRSMLRQDPDIAMVGEIRDLDTADIAIQASLTGHLILSTIHTNDAAGAIPRFLSMNVKPFLLAPALNCVIGQRLVRRICESCKQKIELDKDFLGRVQEVADSMPERVKKDIQKKTLEFFAGKGCEKCYGMGYKGRIGIFEIFIVTEKFEQAILSGQISEYDIERMAVEDGMITMVQDGIIKALNGKTTVEEVFRVID